MSIKAHPPLHVPVLLEAVLAQLQPRPGERYLDLTAGYGGHATAILEQTQTYTTACLVDRDQYALSQLGSLAGQGARLMHCDFLHARVSNLIYCYWIWGCRHHSSIELIEGFPLHTLARLICGWINARR